MYLSWTDDVTIVYPPCTCATGNVQDECLTLMGFMSAGACTKNPCLLTTEFSLFSGSA